MILQHKKWEVGTTNETGKSYIMANRSWLQQKFDKLKKTAQLLIQEVATTHKTGQCYIASNRKKLKHTKQDICTSAQTGSSYNMENRK